MRLFQTKLSSKIGSRPSIILGLTVLLALSLRTYADDVSDETCSAAEVIKEKYKTSHLNTMLQWSSLVYDYAKIRKIVMTYDKGFNPDEEDTVSFKKTELVVTQHISKRRNLFDGTYLKNPVTVHDIRKFVVTNQKYLVDDEGGLEFNLEGDGNVDTDGDGKADLGILKRIMQVDDEFPGLNIVEFNDRLRGSELVYSIIINPAEKRVTVVFRGSVTTMDWLMDLFLFKTLPEEIKSFSNENVGIHNGFADYLFGDAGETGDTKFNQILKILKQIYSKRKYAKYQIYVTGHSLGGALTQLFAYTLAGSHDAADLPKPINAISYASPRVGNSYYFDSFKELESDGKLRHIRVSNEGDMVAVMPSVSYSQTGINIFVRPDKRLEVGYCLDRNAISQFNFDALAMHGLDVYHDRLFIEENEDILGMSIDELYEKYAGFS